MPERLGPPRDFETDLQKIKDTLADMAGMAGDRASSDEIRAQLARQGWHIRDLMADQEPRRKRDAWADTEMASEGKRGNLYWAVAAGGVGFFFNSFLSKVQTFFLGSH